MTRQKRLDTRATTPAALGYRMPAEWAPHAATWLVWPQNRTDWPGKFEPIPWVYAEIVRHLARVERVELIVNDEGVEARAREVLRRSHALSDAVHFHRWPTNRGWTRDSGPIFLTRSRSGSGDLPVVAATKWQFNAWAKYPDWQLDESVSGKIVRHLRLPEWRPVFHLNGRPRRLVLEGGSIDVNGAGMLLTTEECLLSSAVQARNPGLTRADLERVFGEYLGVNKVIWLDRGIAGDDTHGHVDDISRFVGPNTIVTAVEADPADPNHEPLRENLRRLRAERDRRGPTLRVVEIPMPSPVFFKGRRLPASYANFYIANRLVLVPTFNDRNDRVALDRLAELFPKRQVVGIYCGDLIWGLGAIHCMTQQQPAGRS